MKTSEIYCCQCRQTVDAVLVTGKAIYPHRMDLHLLPFWQCQACQGYVGCHHKTKDRTRPLGNIPSEEIRNARKHIHSILDPLWKSGRYPRRVLYSMLNNKLGYEYHTAEIRDIEEARKVYKLIKELAA